MNCNSNNNILTCVYIFHWIASIYTSKEQLAAAVYINYTLENFALKTEF